MENKVTYIKVDDLLNIIYEGKEFSMIAVFIKFILDKLPKYYFPKEN